MNISEYQKCGVVILWIGDRILLSERLKKGKFQGYYGCAGGKIESNEYILDGVCREFQEETGAFLYHGDAHLLDCYILPESKQSVFIFESFKNETFLFNIKNPEPKKHGKWILYKKEEALKLNLMPYIRTYLEKFHLKQVFPKY